jgi:hypothetical protein
MTDSLPPTDAQRSSMQGFVLPLRVLVACEYSGTVRDAFAARGHDAMSCDILPTDKPGNHYQGDVRDVLDDGWDLMIAHPPCTYMTNSGVTWLHRDPTRWTKLDEAGRSCGVLPLATQRTDTTHSHRKPDHAQIRQRAHRRRKAKPSDPALDVRTHGTKGNMPMAQKSSATATNQQRQSRDDESTR